MTNIYLEDWNKNTEIPPTATAVSEEDFFEGMRARYAFITRNLPKKLIIKT